MRLIYLTLVLLSILAPNKIKAQIVLSHSVGDELLWDSAIYACALPGNEMAWGRTFVLQDFGIESNEDFIISSASMGIDSTTDWGVYLQFNIYKIDDEYPTANPVLIGSSQVKHITPVLSSGLPVIETIVFDSPVTVPAGTEIIFVEARQVNEYPNSTILIFAAPTAEDNGISWYKCSYEYVDTVELDRPDARFYIIATGETIMSTNVFSFDTIEIYPNPAKEVLNVKTEKSLVSYEITDVLGKKVSYGNLEPSQTTISINNLNKGIYLLTLQDIDGLITNNKIIKE